MGVWIRNQNKEVLTKANDIWADYNAIFANYVGDIHTWLGDYDSETEALKVLDMIEEHVEGANTTEKQVAMFAGTYKRVFQMPPAGFSEEG